MSDPLLDPPGFAPDWLPSADEPDRLRWFRWALVGVFVVGLGACVVRSADRPADPVLGAPTTTSPARAGLAPEIAEAAAKTVTVFNEDGTGREYCVLVADEPAERERGLMEVTDFSTFEGMLFVFDAEVESTFYMFQTPTPLTITWWRSDDTYVNGAVMDPCLDQPAEQCPRYPAAGPYRYALELPNGGYEGVTLDDRARIRIGVDCPLA